MISSWRRSNLLRGANTTNSTMTSVPSTPVMNSQHTSAAVLWLTLENIIVQVETHLNPTFLHQSLVVVSHHGNILDISQGAMSLIGMTDKTVEEMSKIPGIVIVKAASWNGKNDDTDPLQAYRVAVENGPFSLLKGMLKGLGYTLSQEEGGASGRIGEAFVNIPHTEADDDDEGQHAYQIARDLGASLQMELANHMRYAMIYGVGHDLQSAKLDAMRGSKGEEAGPAEPTAGSKADDQHKMEAGALQRRQMGDWEFEEDMALADNWEADVVVVGRDGENDDENDGGSTGGANGQQDPALHADQQHQQQREEEEEGIQEEGHVCDVCKAFFWEPSVLSIHIEAMHCNHAHPSPSRKQPRASLSSSIPSSNDPPSTQLATSSLHQNATRTRRQKRATSPSFSPSSVAKSMVQPLQGPGQHSITDALGALTSSQDIAVYLKEIGAPRVNLKLWKEAGRERREEEEKHISSCIATSSTTVTARRSADSSPSPPPPPALPLPAPPAVSPPAASSISRGLEGQRPRRSNIISSSTASFLPSSIYSTDDSSNKVILVASAAGAAPLYPPSVPAIGGPLLPLQGKESAAVDDGSSLKSTRRQERAAAREAKRKRKREAKQQGLAHDRITDMNRAIDVK